MTSSYLLHGRQSRHGRSWKSQGKVPGPDPAIEERAAWWRGLLCEDGEMQQCRVGRGEKGWKLTFSPEG